MTGKTEIAYSDNLCCAFMAAIVRAYESGIGEDHYLGRTAMQKLVYFAKTLGVPIPCSFEIYTYGPYSEAVTFSVESLLADDVIKDTSKRKKYSNYRLGENAQDLFEAYEEEIKPFENKIDRLVAALGKFKPEQLELIATLHFACQRLKKTSSESPSKDKVISEFIKFKKDKFPVSEVEGWYKALSSAGLV